VTLAVWLLACAGAPKESAAPAGAAAVAVAGPDVAAVVGVPVTLDGSASVGVSFVWDLGDGTIVDGAVATHTYAEPGAVQAVLTVTGEDGVTRSDAAAVTVVLPAAAVPPVWSSTIVVDGGGAVWAAVPEAGHVAVVDPSAWTSVFVAVCDEPRTVAVDGATLWVACTDALVGVDVATRAVTTEVPLPPGARGYGVVARGGEVWLSMEGRGSLLRWDGAAAEEVTIGVEPRALAWLPDGRLVVSRFRSDPSAASLYVLDGVPITLPYDTSPDSDTTTGGVPNLLDALAVTPDGGTLLAPAHHANVRRGSYLSGLPLDHQTSVRAVMSWVDVGAGVERDRKQFDESGRASAVAPSPSGDALYVVHAGAELLTAVDPWSGDLRGTVREIGAGATGVAVAAGGETVFVHAWLSREVRGYDVTNLSAGAPLVGSASTVAVEPLAADVLAGKRLFWTSADPRVTDSGYIACAHCHPDGRDDGLTWDFTDRGEGLRNTTSLEGRAGTEMGPVHWTGNFDEVQDFENDMRLHFAGAGFLSDADWAESADTLGPAKAGRSEDLDALAAYAASLDQTPPSPFPGDPVGAGLFDTLGCVTCHPPPLYTDSDLATFVRHDVGTVGDGSGQRLGGPLDGFDTPTLLGAWATGPWLHDGRAATIRDAIVAHAEHGTDDPAALDALAAFVEGL
jgi:PKD repeat protein